MATSKSKKRVRKSPTANVNDKGQVFEDEEEIDFNSTASFDVNKYTIGNQAHEITLYVGDDKDELKLTVKDMSWSKRNRIMSQSLTWDTNGNTNFDGDSYVRLCLKEMIISAPWGPTTEAFLVRINDELGAALEQLVPRAFSDNGMDNEIQAIKKER